MENIYIYLGVYFVINFIITLIASSSTWSYDLKEWLMLLAFILLGLPIILVLLIAEIVKIFIPSSKDEYNYKKDVKELTEKMIEMLIVNLKYDCEITINAKYDTSYKVDVKLDEKNSATIFSFGNVSWFVRDLGILDKPKALKIVNDIKKNVIENIGEKVL